MKTFYLEIFAADGVFFRGECVSATVPTPDGQYGILPLHSNFITAVRAGEMHFTTPDGARHPVLVEAGLAKIENNQVLLLVDAAERPEEAEANRALRAAERAKEEELQRRSMREYEASQAALAHAFDRLRRKEER